MVIWFLWGGGNEGQILRIEKRGERGDTVSWGEFKYWGWRGENRDMVSWGG